MKLLILTVEYPSPENPNSGCFLNERFLCYRKCGIDFKIYAPFEEPSFNLRLLRAIKGEPAFHKQRIELDYNTIKYNISYFKQGILNRILHKDDFSYYAGQMAGGLHRDISHDKYDLVVAHYSFPPGLAAHQLNIKYGYPYVVFCHGSDIHQLPFRLPKIKPYILDALNNASYTVFVSNGLLDIAKSYGFSGKNSVVIPNGVDINTFKILDKKSVKTRLGLSLNHKYVGFVGNLIHVKGADRLVSIFHEISIHRGDVKYIIIGDGELRDGIERESVKKIIDVKFTGNIAHEKVAEYMNAIDVLVLPSRNEGWGCVIMEAQACGTPVVGSSVGGIPEAMGDGGFLVKEGNKFEERFADAVMRLLNKPINTESLVARASNFAWEKLVQKEVDIFNRAIAMKS
jgi:glycosyltransferase involved in cell wall biosynthesis